jgi:hypothetical protein
MTNATTEEQSKADNRNEPPPHKYRGRAVDYIYAAIALFILAFIAIFPGQGKAPQSHTVEPARDAVAVNSACFSPRLISAIAAALFVSATLVVARAAIVFAIVVLPPVHAIGTSGGHSQSAVPHEVPSYAADNRTFYAAACLRIIWESECHGGKAEEARNQKRLFHEFLLLQAL